jgi:uncharacterized protein (TIGR02001 family)
MKKLTQLAAAVALTAGAIGAAPAIAEGSLSANIGFASEYYFRGALQKESSASAGVDYEHSGFYIGTWAADVGDGLEVDAYLGWGFETESGFNGSIGFTTYQYTGDFDSDYNEVNLHIGYRFVSLEYSVGEHGKDSSIGIDEASDYDFTALTFAHNGFYATYAVWGKDFEGDYMQLGYDTTISGFDVGVALIFNDEHLGEDGDDDEAIVLTVSKSFEL